MSNTTERIKELDKDIDWLIANPSGTMGATYHDAGKCWTLIDRAIERLRGMADPAAEIARLQARIAALEGLFFDKEDPEFPAALAVLTWVAANESHLKDLHGPISRQHIENLLGAYARRGHKIKQLEADRTRIDLLGETVNMQVRFAWLHEGERYSVQYDWTNTGAPFRAWLDRAADDLTRKMEKTNGH